MEWLSVIGPILVAVGAAYMAYDVARGPVRNARKEVLDRQLQMYVELSESTIRLYQGLSPPYTENDIHEFIEEAKQHSKNMAKSSRDSYQEFMEKEQSASFGLAAKGFALVALGSLAQAIPPFLNLVGH